MSEVYSAGSAPDPGQPAASMHTDAQTFAVDELDFYLITVVERGVYWSDRMRRLLRTGERLRS
jgi:hypothetical protein